MQLLVRLIPADMMKGMPYLDGLGLNWRVVACAGAIAVVATIVFSTTPVLRLSSSKVGIGIAEGSRGSSGNTWHRLGFKLVVLELATATVLLVGAGLLGKSLYRLFDVELGFQPDHLATLQIVVPRSYAPDERLVALGRQIVSRAAGLPGVESAGIASMLPVSFNGNTDWIRFVGRPYNGEHNEVNQRDVSPEYFRTLRAKLDARPILYRRRCGVEGPRRHHQPDAGEALLSGRGSDRQAVWRHQPFAEFDQGDRRHRRRHQGRRARLGDLAGCVLSLRPGPRYVFLARGSHVAGRSGRCCRRWRPPSMGSTPTSARRAARS